MCSFSSMISVIALPVKVDKIQISPLRLRALKNSSGRSSCSTIVLPSRHSTCVTTRSNFLFYSLPGSVRFLATESLGNDELPCISGVRKSSNVPRVVKLARITPLRPFMRTKGKSVMWKFGSGMISKQPRLSLITSSSFLMSFVARFIRK